MSGNQALLCLYTLCTIADRAERTFERLRYLLGGDRPSQTARLTVSQDLIQTVLREPLSASVTFWEATAPVKLPA